MFFFTCPPCFSLLFYPLFSLLFPFFPFPTACFLFMLSKYSFPSKCESAASLFLEVTFPLDLRLDRFLESDRWLRSLLLGDLIFFIRDPSEASDLMRAILEFPLTDASFSFLRLVELFLDFSKFFSSLRLEDTCFLNFTSLETFLLLLLDFFKLFSSNKLESEILIDFS